MKYLLIVLFLLSAMGVQAQITLPTQKQKNEQDLNRVITDSTNFNSGSNKSTTNKKLVKGKYTDYQIISLQRDTTYIDTTLALFKEYKYNYLRKDNFNLLPFANIGQTYNTLVYDFNSSTTMPVFGARARHFNYMEIDDVNYFHVATPLTELMFKTAFEQGQLLDAFFTVNTSRQFNFSIAYKGLRSLGKYQNALTSTGNFRFTTSYKTKNKRYNFRGHVVMQDALNQENGGIINNEIPFFENGTEEFRDRSIFQVNFQNAENILRGKRFHMDHYYDLISKKDSLSKNILRIGSIISFEDKYFEYNQTNSLESYFGSSFRDSGLRDRVTLEDFKAQLNATYINNTIGEIGFNVNYLNYNYGYDKVVVLDTQAIPNRLKGDVIAIGGNYKKQLGAFKLKGQLGVNISGDFNGNYLNAESSYNINDNNKLTARVNLSSRQPNYNYLLYQSNYQNYNWFNNFNNVNTKELIFNLKSKKLLNANISYTTIDNFTYFLETPITSENQIRLTPKPFQTDQTLNYLKVKLTRDIKYGKFGLDNTIVYQEVLDGEDFFNVPQLVTRNTLYFTDLVFKKAMLLQAGITFKYFTKYNMNAYDPLLAEFYVQNDQKFGGFPLLDFFVNAKIRQTRVFLKAEHFNSHFTGYNYYAAPNNPYRDFNIRFGLVWNFFL